MQNFSIVRIKKIVLSGSKGVRALYTSKINLLTYDPTEKDRENALRKSVANKYRGASMIEQPILQYGHSASENQEHINFINWNTTIGTSSTVNANEGNTNLNYKVKPDWMMFFTSCLLLYVSTSLLYQRLRRGVNNFDLPLWAASRETQAKRLLFCIRFTPQERKTIESQYEVERRINPLGNFFDWVNYRYPQFAAGVRYNANDAVNVVASALGSTDSRYLIRIARAFQEAIRISVFDSRERVDTFVNLISVANFAKSAHMQSGLMPPNVLPFAPSVNTTSEHSLYEQPHTSNVYDKYDLNTAVRPTQANTNTTEIITTNFITNNASSDNHGSLPFVNEKMNGRNLK